MSCKMDKHFNNIQRETKAALEDFLASGVKMTTDFFEHFVKISTDCITETVTIFEAELKCKTPEILDVKTSNVDDTLKRKPEETADADEEQPANKIIKVQMEEEIKIKVDTKADDSKTNDYKADDTTDTVFFCVHCTDLNKIDNAFSGTFAEIYNHWSVNHSRNTNPVAFLFYAIPLSICIYCDEVGTYHDLVKHHNDHHSNKPVAIADRKDKSKCGICHFKGADLIEHSSNKHDCLPNIFNPILYSEQMINELSTFGAESTSTNDKNDPIYSVCGFCKEKVNYNQYLMHFRGHTYNYCCSQCSYQTADLSALVCHEKVRHDIESLDYHCSIFPGWIAGKFADTNIQFANGLVLKTYNLRETKFDDSKLFETFIGGYLDLKKERAKQMIERQKPMARSIGTQNQHETSATVDQKSPQARESTPTPAKPTVHSTVSVPRPASSTNSFVPLIAEINKQRRLVNNLFVNGIPRNLNQSELYGIFKSLCQKLGTEVERSDIKDIFQHMNSTGMIVEFRKKDIKIKILKRAADRHILSSDLFRQKSAPWKITIQHQFTPYYFNLLNTALNLKNKRLLFSCKISDNSLIVRRTQSSDEEVILSTQQLMDYVIKV